ncbi:Molybdenum cofactor biosynthesis protein B [archaeon HR01]|nr:Molybdenum cofactor biosynthesis protein B [archaeon HR01]
MQPHEIHRSRSQVKVRVAVLTASTSRYEKKVRGEPFQDESGLLAADILRGMGYEVEYLGVVKDDILMIRKAVIESLSGDFDILVITGGTGISPTDVTLEAVKPFFEKEIEGFGEIFRMESFKQIGAAAMLSRAAAGIANGKLVMAIPGSPKAVETALNLFGREIPHTIFIARGLH